MERTEGAVEEPRLKCTASAFCCGGCWNPDFVTPELVEEFNKVLEENKNKKLSDMGLHCRAICLRVSGGHGPAPTLFVLVEKVGDYVRFTPSESYVMKPRLRVLMTSRHVNRTKTTHRALPRHDSQMTAHVRSRSGVEWRN